MNYSLISPPFTLEFQKMSQDQLKSYKSWFIEKIPERIEILANLVASSPGFKEWLPDYSARSLDALGKWFSLSVQTRPRTIEEISELKAKLSIPIEIPKNELTNQTFSQSIDIGMYLSQIFLREFPCLRWNQELIKKTHVDYGQPVLWGFGNRGFNPVQMIVVLAYGLADNTRGPDSLREIYEIWSKMVKL